MQDTLERVSEGYNADMNQESLREHFMEDFEDFRKLLENGEVRAAEQNPEGDWEAVSEVKEGILLGFQLGEKVPFKGGVMEYSDNDTFPPQQDLEARAVPGGTSVRSGAYVSDDVIIMPPAYINTGAYVDDNTMVDSMALVGSAAQVGEDVHLSTGAKLGGALEPINQTPVIVEDGAMIGGNSGIYEGTVVRENAVIAPNVELSGSTEIYDEIEDEIYTGEVPENAVVIPGSVEHGDVNGEATYKDVALVVKYRDESTDANTALEEALR